MDAKQLPARPNLEQYKKQAKELVKARKSGDAETIERIRKHHPRWAGLKDSELAKARFALTDAQLVIAREHGFESWPKFAKQIETLAHARAAAEAADPPAAFIEAAVWHGTLERAEAILAAHPEVADANIHTAAILGDEARVRSFLARDPLSAVAKGGPLGWDALTHLCFSKYLRLDRARSAGFMRAATALLDAGASANTGFYEKDHQPNPEWESALYGAAGVAHHAGVTRLLLAHGADPNDEEVPYHAPEGFDNDALEALVESGKLTPGSLAMMLLRKADTHDHDGLKYLLEHGADPNRPVLRGYTGLHQVLRRDNALANVDLLLDHGGDPKLAAKDGVSALSLAARRGRADVLASFARRGISMEWQGVERLIAACAQNDAAQVRSIAEREPHLVRQMVAEGGKLLAEFAGTANKEGVRHLLDLGVDVRALFREGDIYFDVATDSTALHVAAWRAWPAVVKLLIERGALVNALDGKGRTPLSLAVRACVDSYWTNRRTPESVEALLRAGADVSGVDFPSGYAEVDELLRQYGKSGTS